MKTYLQRIIDAVNADNPKHPDHMYRILPNSGLEKNEIAFLQDLIRENR